MPTWITDDNGNRASVERWGSEEAAKEALATLEYCSDCSDCSRCFGCSDCSDCSRCSPQQIDDALVPMIENIHQTVYAAVSQPGALDMATWHTCETTHCRAGWVVTLAGDAGKQLEAKTSCLFAALQIYKKSDPDNPIPPTRFFDSDAKALADMKRLAELTT